MSRDWLRYGEPCEGTGEYVLGFAVRVGSIGLFIWLILALAGCGPRMSAEEIIAQRVAAQCPSPSLPAAFLASEANVRREAERRLIAEFGPEQGKVEVERMMAHLREAMMADELADHRRCAQMVAIQYNTEVAARYAAFAASQASQPAAQRVRGGTLTCYHYGTFSQCQ